MSKLIIRNFGDLEDGSIPGYEVQAWQETYLVCCTCRYQNHLAAEVCEECKHSMFSCLKPDSPSPQCKEIGRADYYLCKEGPLKGKTFHISNLIDTLAPFQETYTNSEKEKKLCFTQNDIWREPVWVCRAPSAVDDGLVRLCNQQTYLQDFETRAYNFRCRMGHPYSSKTSAVIYRYDYYNFKDEEDPWHIGKVWKYWHQKYPAGLQATEDEELKTLEQSKDAKKLAEPLKETKQSREAEQPKKDEELSEYEDEYEEEDWSDDPSSPVMFISTFSPEPMRFQSKEEALNFAAVPSFFG